MYEGEVVAGRNLAFLELKEQETPVHSPEASHRTQNKIRMPSFPKRPWVGCPLIPRPVHPPYRFPRPAGTPAFCFLIFGPPLAPLSPGLPGLLLPPSPGAISPPLASTGPITS